MKRGGVAFTLSAEHADTLGHAKTETLLIENPIAGRSNRLGQKIRLNLNDDPPLTTLNLPRLFNSTQGTPVEPSPPDSFAGPATGHPGQIAWRTRMMMDHHDTTYGEGADFARQHVSTK
jgi:hypothetical protein